MHKIIIFSSLELVELSRKVCSCNIFCRGESSLFGQIVQTILSLTPKPSKFMFTTRSCWNIKGRTQIHDVIWVISPITIDFVPHQCTKFEVCNPLQVGAGKKLGKINATTHKEAQNGFKKL
jgi:hypothetical protein